MRAPAVLLIPSAYVGSSCLEPLANALRDRVGWPVDIARTAPDQVGPPYYPNLARAIATDRRPCGESITVLIAHSGAGGLMPAIAESLGGTVRAAILMDAVLPHPGRSAMETMPEMLASRLRAEARNGRLPPWNRWFGPHVMEALLPDRALRLAFEADVQAVPAAFVDEVAPDYAGWGLSRIGYLQLSAGYAAEAGAAEANGWLVRRDILHHLAIVTEPARVAESLHAMVVALGVAPIAPESR